MFLRLRVLFYDLKKSKNVFALERAHRSLCSARENMPRVFSRAGNEYIFIGFDFYEKITRSERISWPDILFSS